MPNHCWNRCYVTGESEDLDEFMLVLEQDGNPQLTNFRTMPKILKNTSFERDSNGQERVVFVDHEAAAEDPEKMFTSRRELTAAELAEVEKHGGGSWYEWAIENWSTKWGDWDTKVEKREEWEILLTFTTAWSPPNELLKYIVKNHRVTIVNQWREEGGCHGSDEFR